MSGACARLAALVAAVVLAAGPVLAKDKDKDKDNDKGKAREDSEAAPREPGVERERVGEATLTTAVLPGRVLDLAPARAADGTPGLYALVQLTRADAAEEPAAKPAADGEKTPKRLPPCPESLRRALYRVALGDPPRLDLVLEGLPSDVAQFDLTDLDGDGAEEPLFRRPGEILLAHGAALESLVRDPGLGDRPYPEPTDAWPASSTLPHAVSISVGRLELFGPGADGAWARRAGAELPIDVHLFGGQGMRVSSQASYVGPGEGGRLLYVTRPRSVGETRLTAVGVSLSPSGEATSVEAWMRLPEPERLIESRALVAEGRLRLLVTTQSAEKLELFGEKRLRLYDVEPDRSRLGRPPVWQATSRINLWQQAHPYLLDADRDGHLDLVIGYWKGLSGARVVLDLYRGLAEGGFADAPVATAFDVEDGDRGFLHYGGDPTGDGRPDLVLIAGGNVAIHAGLDSKRGSEIVSRHPVSLTALEPGATGETYVAVGSGGVQAWTGPAGSTVRFADLDGDGADEVVQHARGRHDDTLRVIDLLPAGSPAPESHAP